MNKKIVGGVLLVGVVVITAISLTFGNNNEQPSEASTATTEVTKTTKTSKNTDKDNQSADDSFAEPKGVSETAEPKPKNHDQSDHNHQPSKKSPKKASTQSTANTNQTDNSNQSANSESTNNSNDSNTADNNNDAEAKARAEEEARYQEELARTQAQYPTTYQANNSYKWKDDCPGGIENLTIQPIGGYPVCQCTSYVAWKTFETSGIILSNWGNANFWDTIASANGYLVDNTPTINSIGQMKNSGYGHLFWVEQVYSDGSIAVTEYNDMSSTYQLTGDYHDQDFGARIIPAQMAASYRYIHPNQRVW